MPHVLLPCTVCAGEEFEVVQHEVAALLKGRVLVGHAVYNDLKVLMLSHPKKHTRDTARSVQWWAMGRRGGGSALALSPFGNV